MFRIAFKDDSLALNTYYILTDELFETMATIEDNGMTIVEVL